MMNEKQYNRLITALSILIPVVVAGLFGVKVEGYDFTFLPPIYASINGLTAVLLIVAVVAIKNGKRKLHEWIMKLNILLSITFLVMYILYHMTSDPTAYLVDGWTRYFYFFILITHILLSILLIPMILITFSKALMGDFEGHRRFAKITFPLWLYVASTGVVVYLMISPFYT